MKKILIIFIIVLFAGVNHAQLLRGAGVKLGLTIASQEWDYAPVNIDPNNRAGFNIGIFAEFFDMPIVSVIGEINYVQKGLTGLGGIIFDETLGGDIRLNYLNFSVLGKLRIDYIAVSPYIVAGPKLDIELSRDAIANSLIINNFSKERLGFKIGLGTEIHLPAASLLVEVLYDTDFNQLYNQNNLSIDTKSYDLRIGLMF
jgi:hypothetical protein